jgi:hypothetical protein
MKAEPSAESSQYLHSTAFQNYSMIAVGQVAMIITKHLFLNMKLKWNLTEKVVDTGSSFQVMVN